MKGNMGKGKAGKCMLAVKHFGRSKGTMNKTGSQSSTIGVAQFGSTSNKGWTNKTKA
jgi:hypothetical protein